MTIVSSVLLILGGLFYLLGGLGILRMPDTFNRIQAGTKATTLGAFSVLVGVAFAHFEWAWISKIIIIIVFIVISNPVGSSTIAKANYRAKNIPDNLVQDDLAKRGDGE
jgi:multicomponent Na+:H+ antiporter subunit G